jgi:hypothetical protein
MNQFSETIDNAMQEFEEWRSSSPETKPFEEEWLDNIMVRLADLKQTDDMAQFDRKYRTLMRMLTDSGPTSSDVAPALDSISTAMEKRNRRNR